METASAYVNNQSSAGPKVLVLTPFGKDTALVSKVLSQSGFTAIAFDTLEKLTSQINEDSMAAVLTEENLQNGAISYLAQKLAAQPPWSDLPLIVLTGGGMSTENTELAVRSRAPLGNMTLLERPLRPATLISAVRNALASRQRQYEIRDHLLQREASEQELRRAHHILETKVEERTAALRRLSARLMRVQDEERRRIARELHDSLGQYLAAAKINLDVASNSKANGSASLREAQQLVDRAITDIRTLSHLLHPPLLDEAGFGSAARWFVEGFGKRSGIATNLRMPADLDRLPREIETALFRILQEALTNVHRHSGTSEVDVRLTIYRTLIVTLTVQDHGCGIPAEVLENFHKSGAKLGVGLAGMRERVKELGGKLEIESDASGTCLRATIPVPISSAEPAAKPVATAFPESWAV